MLTDHKTSSQEKGLTHLPFNNKKMTFLSLEWNALHSFRIWPMPNQLPGQLYGPYILH